MYRWWQGRFGWAASMALFALLLQAFLPLGQALALSRSYGDGYSRPIIVCSLTGPKLVYDATDQEIPARHGGDVRCPLCIAHAVVGTALNNAVEIVVPRPQSTAGRSLPVADTFADALATPHTYQSRAPPLVR
jgi:hypothetical protein